MNETKNMGDIFNVSPIEIENIKTEDIKDKIKIILSSVFVSGLKTDIITFSNRFSFACPYCGDSTGNHRKKRGNIYFEGFSYHCYNCGIHKSAHRFFEDFNKYLNLEPFELLRFKLIHKIEKKVFEGLSFLLNEQILKYTFSKEYIKEKYKFKDIENTPGQIYLLKRFQTDMKKFAWDEKTKSIVIFNLDNDDNVIGFQKRILAKHIQNKYINYPIKRIYEDLNLSIISEIEHLNSISLIFGLLTVDFNKTITVFEGSLDSFLYPNSIAFSTAHKELPFESDDIQYWFDFDKTGNQKTSEYLLENKKVFLWKLFFKDYGVSYNNIQKLDLTDLMQILKNNNIYVDFEKYFSNSRMDIIFT